MKDNKIISSLILVCVGIVLFLGNFIPIFSFNIIWPVIIIIVGLGLMFRDLYHD